jgi:effector-binding domain-containing protein
MKVLKTIFKLALVLVVVVGVVGVFLPSSAHIERSAVIEAPQATVFVLVNGFRSFNRWSPWYDRDPNADFSYDGPDYGVGSKMMWSSQQSDVGSGSQEIIASEPYQSVRTHLDFGQKGTAEAYFELEADDTGTQITWGLDTEFGWDLVGRYFGLMFYRIVGAEYEKGLANLKEVAESMPGVDWSGLNVQIVIVDSFSMAYADGNSSWERADIAQALGAAYSQVRAFMNKHKLEQSGPPLAVTRLATDEEWHFEAGIPLVAAPASEPTEDAQVFVRDTYAGKAVRAIHVGSYAGISDTIEEIDAYIAAFGLEKNGNLWEEWISDPGTTPEDRLITNICMPIR